MLWRATFWCFTRFVGARFKFDDDNLKIAFCVGRHCWSELTNQMNHNSNSGNTLGIETDSSTARLFSVTRDAELQAIWFNIAASTSFILNIAVDCGWSAQESVWYNKGKFSSLVLSLFRGFLVGRLNLFSYVETVHGKKLFHSCLVTCRNFKRIWIGQSFRYVQLCFAFCAFWNKVKYLWSVSFTFVCLHVFCFYTGRLLYNSIILSVSLLPNDVIK